MNASLTDWTDRLRRFVPIAGAILFLLSEGVVAAGTPEPPGFSLFPFDAGLAHFVQSYYRHKEPQAALDLFFQIDFDKFEAAAAKAQQPHSRAILMAFFAQVLHENPDLTMPFAERLVAKTAGSAALFGEEVIAYGAAQNRARAMELVARQFRLPPERRKTLSELEVFPYARLQATDRWALDVLWACFFATGSSDYLARLAAPLAAVEPTREETAARLRALVASKPSPESPEYRLAVRIAEGEAVRFAFSAVAERDREFGLLLKAILPKLDPRAARIVREMLGREGPGA